MQSNYTMRVTRIIESVERRYDPEHDVIPGGPSVTWADTQLLNIIKCLITEVEGLQEQIDMMSPGRVNR